MDEKEFNQLFSVSQVIAFVCILAGFGLAVYLWVVIGTDMSSNLRAHVSIGVITTAFAILQALAVVARPKPDAKYRQELLPRHMCKTLACLLSG